MDESEKKEAPARLFISYARADRARVAPLARALETAGHTVWWDTLIDGGTAFARTIETELDRADAVIVVWTRSSIESDWVRDEAGRGRDRRRLVPVTIGGVDPPLGFRQYHAIDLSRWDGRVEGAEFHALERGIHAVRGIAPPEPRRAGRLHVPRRTMLMAGGGAAVLAAAGGLALWRPWRGATPDNTVAVMPFKNLGGDPAQDYFSDGLAEEIRGTLAHNPALQIAAPTSTRALRDHGDDVRAIADQLGVAHVLLGSVRKAGDVVRVVASLVSAANGFTAWSQTFDRKLTDIFAVQSEIANTVARALSASVAAKSTALGGTDNIAAYDAFLQGRALFDSDGGEQSDRAALAKLDRAVAADPHYALAHALRSRVLAALASQYGRGNALRAQYDAAIAAARTAVALAPQLAAGHAALGFATFNGLLDARGARDAYDRAAQYGAGDADILVLVAFFRSKTGHPDDALTAIHRAQTLDPLNPRTWRAEGSILLAARHFAPAIVPLEKALGMNPGLSTAHSMIGTAHFALGDFSAAQAAFKAEPADSLRQAGLAICAFQTGDKAGAQRLLDRLTAENGDGAAYQQAQVLARMGRGNDAIDALLRGLAASDGGLTGLLGDVMLDPLRDDARFNRLLADIGFT